MDVGLQCAAVYDAMVCYAVLCCIRMYFVYMHASNMGDSAECSMPVFVCERICATIQNQKHPENTTCSIRTHIL